MIPADQFPGTGKTRTQFSYLDHQLCWLDGHRPTCHRWSAPQDTYGTQPTGALDGSRGTHPFGTTSRFTQLAWVGDILCAVDDARRLHCVTPSPAWTSYPETPNLQVQMLSPYGIFEPDGSIHAAYIPEPDFYDVEEEPGPAVSLLDMSSDGKQVLGLSAHCELAAGGDLRCDSGSSPLPDDVVPRALFGSAAHTCILDAQDALWCWGDPASGQLGAGDSHCTREPRELTDVFLKALASP